MELAKSNGYWKLINQSSFVEALKHQKNPIEINEYIESREAIGKWDYRKIAEAMEKDSTINYEDFFWKRIIVFALISEHMKEEHGC